MATAENVETIAAWDAKAERPTRSPSSPARVLMQYFTGVPAIVDLAAMLTRSTSSAPTRRRSTRSFRWIW